MAQRTDVARGGCCRGEARAGADRGSGTPFVALGAAYALLGVVFIVFAFARNRAVDRALARGEFAPLDERVAAVLTGIGVALGIATVLIVLLA